MDQKLVNRVRKASVLSNKSVRFSLDAYRSSTDRHLKQAELFLLTELTEERRPSRPPVRREESIEPTFLDDFFSRQKSENITSLSRADSCFSPREAHPSHRLREFPLKEEQIRPEDVSGDYVSSFPEPHRRGTIADRAKVFIHSPRGYCRAQRRPFTDTTLHV